MNDIIKSKSMDLQHVASESEMEADVCTVMYVRCSHISVIYLNAKKIYKIILLWLGLKSRVLVSM